MADSRRITAAGVLLPPIGVPMAGASKTTTGGKSTKEQVELQDLGGGHWRAICGDRSFETDERDGDLWVDHRELARFYEYAESNGPAKFAELIDQCLKVGLVNDSEVSTSVVESKKGRPGKVIMLKRKAALLVSARCNQPRAMELTRKMADVFEQWLDRRHQTPSFDPTVLAKFLVPMIEATVHPLVATLSKELEKRGEEIKELHKELKILSTERGSLSSDQVKAIKARLREIANLDSGLPGSKMTRPELKVWRASFGTANVEARNAVGLSMNRGWERLSPNKFEDLKSNLDLQYERARKKDALREPLMDWAKKSKN